MPPDSKGYEKSNPPFLKFEERAFLFKNVLLQTRMARNVDPMTRHE